MKVLVIPEDPTLDQFILKPVVERIFRELDCRARVQVLSNPRIEGVAQALSAETIERILSIWPMADLFLIIVDRDCALDRQQSLDRRVREVGTRGKKAIGCLAVEEVEVWALALHRDKLSVRWSDVRAHCDPKEAYFDPLVKRSGWLESDGKGRAAAMRELPGNWRSLKSHCEEIQQLEDAIRAWLQAGRD